MIWSYLGVSENITILSGKIEQIDIGSNIYLSQSSKGEILDSLKVKSDSFQFKLNVLEGDAYFIQFEINSQIFAQIVYLENGSKVFITITKDFKNITFIGSALAEEQSNFINGLLPISYKQKLLDKKFINNKDSLNIKQNLKEDLIIAESEYYLDWVKKHLNSPFSVVVICFYMEKTNIFLLEKLYDKITGKAKENNLVTQRIPMYFAQRKENENFEIGKRLKDFVLNDTLDKSHSIKASIKNNYVLLDIWATWCSPCRKSIPAMKEIWNTYHNRNFKIISISADTDFKLWKEVIQKDKMNWYHLSDLKGTDSGFMKDNNIYAYPTYILISPQGIILSKPYNIEGVEKVLADIFNKK